MITFIIWYIAVMIVIYLLLISIDKKYNPDRSFCILGAVFWPILILALLHTLVSYSQEDWNNLE